MATLADLDAELEAAVIAETLLTQRMISDYAVESGEPIPAGEYRFRQRLDVVSLNPIDSNQTLYLVQCEIDWLVMMEVNGLDIQERDYTAGAWLDQQTLTNGLAQGFWRSLPSVFDINLGTPPQIADQIARVGSVLTFTVGAQVFLNA